MKRGVLTDEVLSGTATANHRDRFRAGFGSVWPGIYRDPRRMDTAATIAVLIVPAAHANLLQREMATPRRHHKFPSLSE
jgi:hypothetical protein